jgi:hypothetical protein
MVKIWWGGVQVVAMMSSSIKSPRLQPHLDGNVEKLVGVVWFSRISSGGSPDLHGASSTIIPFSSSSGRMWSF